MYPFTHEQYYNFQRQQALLNMPARERVNLSDGLRFSAVREAFRQAVTQIMESLAREGETCLQLEPACEMRFM